MAGQKTDKRDVHVGQRIAEQRKQASLTQKDVAQIFGMSAAQLQKYEKGANRISAIHLELLSRLIGVPMDYFFEGIEENDTDSTMYTLQENKQKALDNTREWRMLISTLGNFINKHFDPETKLLVKDLTNTFLKKLTD